MPQIEVHFSDTRLKDYADKILALRAQGRIEMSRGQNDAGKVILTNVRRALKQQMGVSKYATVLAVTDAIPASPERLDYTITATGKGLPIRDFPVSAVPGGSVTASPWGVPHEFQRSFMTSKKGLLLARVGDAREPVRRLYGPSPRKELVKGESLKTFENAVRAVAEPIIVRRLARLMP